MTSSRHPRHAPAGKHTPPHQADAVGEERGGERVTRVALVGEAVKGEAESLGAVDLATINAMRLFFRDWRAVAGLIAVGGAWYAGQWVMHVRRQDE